MKKGLYIALGVQSLALLGVLVALGYSAFSPPHRTADVDELELEVELAGEASDEAPAGVLQPSSSPSSLERSSDGGALPSPGGGSDGGAALAASTEGAVTGAISELVEGNQRFVQGVTRTRDVLALRRAPGPPVAVVVACSDAVVPVELLFDQPLGALVVVRTPAHVIDAAAVAAVDDAVLKQRVPVVLVLGHRGCPTVAAASHPKAPGEPALAAKVRAGLASLAKGEHRPVLEAQAAEANVSWAVGQLTRSSKGVKVAKPSVLRTLYDEETGEVRWLDAEATGEDQSARTHQ